MNMLQSSEKKSQRYQSTAVFAVKTYTFQLNKHLRHL